MGITTRVNESTVTKAIEVVENLEDQQHLGNNLKDSIACLQSALQTLQSCMGGSRQLSLEAIG